MTTDRTHTPRLPIGILCADGVEQVEVTVPRAALTDAGFDVELISPDGGPVRGYHYIEPGDLMDSQVALPDARPDRYSCLVLPGGLGGPDTLRNDTRAVDLVRSYWHLERPVATICHGPWVLIDAGTLAPRSLTCAPQITTDVVNAGARYVDEAAHVDDSRGPVLISGRNHDTVDQFADTLVRVLDAAR